MNLSEQTARVHIANAKWWINIHTGAPLERNVGELLMLVVSELAEALEGHRKNLMDDKLPHRPMVEVELADTLIRLLDIAGGMHVDIEKERAFIKPGTFWHFSPTDNVGESLLRIVKIVTNTYEYQRTHFSLGITATILAVQEFAAHFTPDLDGVYEEKMAYNAVRADHQHEARLKADGKKY